MIEIVRQATEKFNKLFSSAQKYTQALLATQGRKVCTNLGKSTGISHDEIQRSLTRLSDNPETIRSQLHDGVLRAAQKTVGYLITDSTLLVKETAKAMEGVSLQHSGNERKLGISLTAVVWTDLNRVLPLDLFTWKKGDPSKIATATDMVIRLAQRVNAKAVLADAAFASRQALQSYQQAHAHCLMRFHANRVVTVKGYDKPEQVKNHPAFKLRKNRRIIVREVMWNDLSLRIIAMKIKRHCEYQIIFLVTTFSINEAYTLAKLYRHRWKVETFFRTTKQRFGLAQCQAHCLKKQEAHALAGFLAYMYSRPYSGPFTPTSLGRKKASPFPPIPRPGLNFQLVT